MEQSLFTVTIDATKISPLDTSNYANELRELAKSNAKLEVLAPGKFITQVRYGEKLFNVSTRLLK